MNNHIITIKSKDKYIASRGTVRESSNKSLKIRLLEYFGN